MICNPENFEALRRENDELRRLVAAIGNEAASQGADWALRLVDQNQQESHENAGLFLSIQNELNLSDIAANIPGAIYQFLQRPDGTQSFPYVSPASEKLFGIPLSRMSDPDWVIGRIHPDDLAAYAESTERAERNFERWTMEMRVVKPNGQIVWVFCSSSPRKLADGGILWNGVILDITEYKRTEGALKESEERFRLLVKNSSDILVIIDSDGTQRYVSPSSERITGFQASELMGRSLAEIIHPDDMDNISRAWNEAVEHPEKVVTVEYRHIHKTRGWVHLEAKGQNFEAEPSVGGFVANVRDISERKRVEEEREKLRAQLAQAQKMESVGRLAGGVAHDFNNMLGGIIGYAEIALEQVDPAQPLYGDLTQILKAAERSSELTRQLLGFARKQTVAPRVLDLNGTVEGMLKMLRRIIGEGIDLAWLPGKSLGAVKMDPAQVDQVLANLCINAKDAMGEKGKMTIETANVVIDDAYCAGHAGSVPGDYVLLAVSDNGSGMDRETAGRIFEPFFTTKEVGRGTGLGLATVYGIVKQNSGYISVYSEPGQGTTFKIYLPRHPEGPEGLPAADVQRKISAGSETILLVEDEPIILSAATKMLKRRGYAVLAASTPGEAVKIAGGHPGDINLLMTDVVMPEMNGRDLAKKLLAMHPGLRLLFMSGYTANVIAHHGVLDEGVHFIQKPFTPQDLALKVREVLDG